jgi:hypothetical protein
LIGEALDRSGWLEVRLRSPGDGLDTETLIQRLKFRRRIIALRKAGTEADYRKYKALGHGFRLGTGTSAEGCVVGAIRSGKTISNRRLTDVSSKTETWLQRRSDETIFERP